YFLAALGSLVALGSLASLLSLLALVSLVSFFARGLRAAPFLGVSSAASSDSSFLLRPKGRISSAVRSARAPRCTRTLFFDLYRSTSIFGPRLCASTLASISYAVFCLKKKRNTRAASLRDRVMHLVLHIARCAR